MRPTTCQTTFSKSTCEKRVGRIKKHNFYKHNHFFTTEQNTITSQLLQYAFVHLQLAGGVWNLLQEGKNWQIRLLQTENL
jgi:hypothetical protein